MISQPQAGILGTYAVVKRPWVVKDSFGKDVIAIRPIMNITLTYDHRLVDGALAGRFLAAPAREARELGRKRLLSVPHRRADRAGSLCSSAAAPIGRDPSKHRITQLGENFGGS